MSFTQGGAQRPLSLSVANVFVTGNSSVGNAFTVQQLGVSAVASFLGSGGSGMFVDTIGRVGINTTTPTANLQVSGNVYISNALTTTNVFSNLVIINLIPTSIVYNGTVTGTIVLAPGTYQITAIGGQGGGSAFPATGGAGRLVTITYTFANQVTLQYRIGGAGTAGTVSGGGGGGGATYVYDLTDSLWICVAGGGGGSYNTTTSQGTAATSTSAPGAGGGGTTSTASGGGGITGDGASGSIFGGKSYANGSAGAGGSANGGTGGFGGGGGGNNSSGGGGGGYTGGNSSAGSTGATGGTSFAVAGSVVITDSAAVSSGNGSLSITFIPTTTTPVSLYSVGTGVITGNLIVSNVFTSPIANISNIYTSNISGVLLSQWTGATGQPIYYVPQVGIGSTTTPTSNLQITGNLYVSNAITTTNAYISNIYTSNIQGFVGSQWTGTVGQPLYYVPYVGIGSTTTPTSNLQITGNVYVSNTITTSNLNAGVGALNVTPTTVSVGFDTFTAPYITVTSSFEDYTKRAPHLQPTTSNAFVIQNWITISANYISSQNSFWAPASRPVFSNVTSGTPGSNAYVGSVSMSDGRTVFIPYGASTFGLFNSATNQYSPITPSGASLTPTSGWGNGLYFGGVQAPSGNIVCIPHVSGNIGLFEPEGYTFSNALAHNCPSGAFAGGVLDGNSNITMIPYNSLNVCTYNGSTGLFSNMVQISSAAPRLVGGVLLPTGNIIGIPFGTSNLIQYSPTARTFSNTAIGSGFFGGVLTTNGNVVCVPYTASNVIVLNPTTSVFSNVVTGANGFAGGTLLPNGQIAFTPFTNSNVGLFNPTTLSLSNILPQQGGPTSNAYFGASLTTDGRLVFCPNQSTNLAMLNTTTPLPSQEFRLVPYLNKL